MRPDGRQYGAHGRRLYSTWSLHFRQSYSRFILPCPPTPVKAFPRFALPSHRLYTEITGSYPQLPQSFQQPQPVVVQGIPCFFQNYAGPELVVFYPAKVARTAIKSTQLEISCWERVKNMGPRGDPCLKWSIRPSQPCTWQWPQSAWGQP